MSIASPAGTAYDLRLEDVQAIAADVWASIAHTDEVIDESLTPTGAAPLRTGAHVVRAHVDVRGAWNGRVVLELTETGAHRIAATMLGGDVPGPPEVTDAVGELVNIVGGNIKSLLPAPSTLGLPVVGRGVVSGTGVDATTEARAVELCRADLAWAGEALRVSVWTAAEVATTNQGRKP